MLSDVEEEGRGGIPKRYGRGLYSTRRTKMDRERATLARLGWLPNSCKGAWRKCIYVSEDVREGWIRTAVHGRLADITELKAPVDARSGNKKWLGPQGNDHRLAES
jgi:hypothetical protein